MNNTIYKIALAGGIFAILTFIHFSSDFLLQSHSEAMVKHNTPKVRAKHCIIYTLSFAPMFYICSFSFWQWVIGLNVLFWSHFYLDTYHFVFVWAKHIRRPPEMTCNRHEEVSLPDGHKHYKTLPPDPIKGFGEFVQTALGKILLIAVDQITHLSFLFPIVYMVMQNL